MQNKTLLEQLTVAYPKITFAPSDMFAWVPERHTVNYRADEMDTSQLFHELAHALLSHCKYDRDIALIEMERDAWHLGEQLATKYGLAISEDAREDAMDSYRDWLHTRSLCPDCGANGIQTAAQRYECFMCHASWLVNDARVCGLKRTLIKK